jgi:hypothetical protein
MKKVELKSDMVIYQREDGTHAINVRMKGETVWLSQAQIADLFGVQVPAISKHIKNIFDEGELDEKVVISILETTT